MKVAFTPEADRQATELDRWWREHRPAAPDLFARELAEGLELLSRAPNAATSYTAQGGRTFRRFLLPRSRNHVYFEIDEVQGLLIVHAVWGTPRGREPDLE